MLSLFASGGFRGDLSQVGADGCLYLTQDGTRYDDGTVTNEDSLVQICGGFAPPRPADVSINKVGPGVRPERRHDHVHAHRRQRRAG